MCDDVFITVYLHQLLIVRLSYTDVFDRGSRTYFCTPTTVGGVWFIFVCVLRQLCVELMLCVESAGDLPLTSHQVVEGGGSVKPLAALGVYCGV